MRDVLKLIWWGLIGLFRSRASLEAEILVLRHQLNVLRRRSPKRLAFSNLDRLIFAGLYAVAPRILSALAIVEPQTVVRWHRAGFRLFWRWKSQSRSGRPRIPLEIRRLIREMSLPTLSGALRESMANFSSSASTLAKPQSPSTWRGTGDLLPRAGRRSCAIMPMRSHRLIYSSFRRSHFGCCMAF